MTQNVTFISNGKVVEIPIAYFEDEAKKLIDGMLRNGWIPKEGNKEEWYQIMRTCMVGFMAGKIDAMTKED